MACNGTPGCYLHLVGRHVLIVENACVNVCRKVCLHTSTINVHVTQIGVHISCCDAWDKSLIISRCFIKDDFSRFLSIVKQ